MDIEVFIPYFNHDKYVIKSIESIKSLQVKENNFMIKIVNDGSNYREINNLIKKNKFAFDVRLENSINRGSFYQIISSLKSTNADLLFILNSDDEFDENRIDNFTNAMRDKHHAWGFSNVQVCNEGYPDKEYESFLNKILDLQQICKNTTNLHLDNYGISTGNLVFKNPKYYSNLFQHFKFDMIHDWYMFRILSILENPVYLPDKLYRYRLHNSNTINQSKIVGDVEGNILQYIEKQLISLSIKSYKSMEVSL